MRATQGNARRWFLAGFGALAGAAFTVAGVASTPQTRPRARDLGISPGAGSPGPLNAITDVAGVAVGHVTLTAGDSVRTGVTVVVPHPGNVFREKVPGAVFIGNAFGKLAGSTQVQELGTIETPIVLTNTLSVGAALDGLARWTVAQAGNENVRSVNGLVGETNDGGLNDIRGFHITADHVRQAISAARAGVAVEEGSVGAGTGTVAFGWKGGIGTSSRTVTQGANAWTVGVLVQSNFGGRLTIAGAPVWRELKPGAGGFVSPKPSSAEAEAQGRVSPKPSGAEGEAKGRVSPKPSSAEAEAQGRVSPKPSGAEGEAKADGSCMIIVATDAPLDARDLERLAARAIFAMARTGSTYSNGSGDFAIAFSTNVANRVAATNGPQPRSILPTDALSGLFEAVLDATEEAIYNSMLRATDVTGNGRTIRAIPIEPLTVLLKRYIRG